MPENYASVLRELKRRISSAQQRAALSVNRELIALYLDIGRRLAHEYETSGWGDKVIECLAHDLRRAFPEMKGFSRTNLFYMRQCYFAYKDDPQLVQQAVGLIPWGHNLAILAKLKGPEERAFYLRETIAHGWSRNVLIHQIESALHQRQGGAVTNFRRALPPAQSELAAQTIKDPYVFDFLGLTREARERELHQALVENIRDMLLELGRGFAFVGSQFPLSVAGEDYYIDLLFYHLQLRCYVVIDLKSGKFLPEHSGKMNFYLSAVDDLLRGTHDQPAIGLILCRDRNNIIAEY
ncbi:MAG TPA: PDDEXK nuclease domain-containing protein, partial [bacterium]|nr:PDDEXK nuclease domain-containing protein [bacterium]